MQILVTGGTGVIGAGLVPELLKRGHHVRLLSRHASDEAAKYPPNVEAFNADVTDTAALRGAAEGCRAVIHITGIVDESPPEVTFERVNVDGTRHVLNEATRAHAQRFIFVSSLGADRGESEYHKSKRHAEDLVRRSDLSWTIVRPGNVYGPGDDVISKLLKLVRSLPAVPTVDWGEHRFQPVWFEDLGRALAELVENENHSREVLEIAGNEITSASELIEKFSEITGRKPMKLPVPESVVAGGVAIAEKIEPLKKLLDRAGLSMPISSNKLQMLVEENVIREPSRNAIRDLRVSPTPLSVGLPRLANELPELLPDNGVGAMTRKRFVVEIVGSNFDARELMKRIEQNIDDVMPIDFEVEPNSPKRVEPNATLTAAVPGRGNVQVRAIDVHDLGMTLLTVEGHPLAGAVEFKAEDMAGGAMRFTIEVNARAANFVDWVALSTIGGAMQNANWRGVIHRVVELSGGSARDDLLETEETLDEQDAETVTQRLANLVETT